MQSFGAAGKSQFDYNSKVFSCCKKQQQANESRLIISAVKCSRFAAKGSIVWYLFEKARNAIHTDSFFMAERIFLKRIVVCLLC